MTDSDRQRVEDALLVLRAQAGSERAFTRLFERYEARLLYYLRRVSGSPDVADDAFQEAWLKAFRRLGTLKRPAAFRSWLYRIGRNSAMDALRRRGRELPLEDPRARDAMEALDRDRLADGPDDDFGEATVAALHVALDRIAPIHREVLALKFLEDLSYEEIADVVGIPIGTVRSRIHHGRRSLRRETEAVRLHEPSTGEEGR